MHVRSSGDLVEITRERDSLAINCDLSEVHSCNHTCSGYDHEHVQTRKFIHSLSDSNCRDLCRGGRLSGHRELTHVFVEFLYDSVRRLYCTESSWIRVLYEIVS